MLCIIPPEGPILWCPLSEEALATLNRMPGLGADTVVVADSVLPPVLRFPTLVVSSPGRLANRDLKDTLNEYHLQRLYMPLPTEEEVLALHAVAFPHLDEAGVRRRMQLWGPIPRHVLVSVAQGEQAALWSSAEGVSLDALVALSRGQATNNIGGGDGLDAPHRLVHERAAGQDAPAGSVAAVKSCPAYYSRGIVAIASPSLLRHIAERLEREQKWNASFLVDVSVGIGALGALRGIKFEEIVLAMMEEGFEFECRELEDVSGTVATGSSQNDHERRRSVRKASKVLWSTASDLVPHRGAESLLVPRDRLAAGLDALFWDEKAGHHWPLDCTVSATHGLHAQGLAEAVFALGWTPKKGWPKNAVSSKKRMEMHIKYFWAVPEDRFHSGWTKRQAAKKGSNTSDAATATFEAVKQYVLCVPASVTITRLAKACQNQGVPLPQELVRAL